MLLQVLFTSWYESSLSKVYTIGQFELDEPVYPSDYDGRIVTPHQIKQDCHLENGKTVNFEKLGVVLEGSKTQWHKFLK